MKLKITDKSGKERVVEARNEQQAQVFERAGFKEVKEEKKKDK